jgi:hypothetical protein
MEVRLLKRLPADPIPETYTTVPDRDADPLVWQKFWRDAGIEPVDTYIAGGRSVQNGRNWREWIEAHLPVVGLDPFRDSKQDALYQFVAQDIALVERAQLIIAYYPGGYASHGMAAEMGYAAATNTPILYVDESEQPDMFLIGLSKRFFPSLEDLAAWWARRAVNGIVVP